MYTFIIVSKKTLDCSEKNDYLKQNLFSFSKKVSVYASKCETSDC